MSRTVLTPGDEGVNAYALLTSLVVPRPIAWVSTVDAAGHGNLAPHSFFTVASNSPPTVLFCSIGRKDTVRNVEATGEFVVNMTDEPLAKAMHESSGDFPPDVGEPEYLNLKVAPSTSTTSRPRPAASWVRKG